MAINISGKSFRGNQVVSIGIASKFYALGIQNAERICSKLGFYPQKRMHQLTEEEGRAIAKELTAYTIETEARNQMRANIALKRTIGSFAGRRHAMGLPVRGQGTRNNAKTAKKLNKLERRNYSTQREVSASTLDLAQLVKAFKL